MWNNEIQKLADKGKSSKFLCIGLQSGLVRRESVTWFTSRCACFCWGTCMYTYMFMYMLCVRVFLGVGMCICTGACIYYVCENAPVYVYVYVCLFIYRVYLRVVLLLGLNISQKEPCITFLSIFANSCHELKRLVWSRTPWILRLFSEPKRIGLLIDFCAVEHHHIFS